MLEVSGGKDWESVWGRRGNDRELRGMLEMGEMRRGE